MYLGLRLEIENITPYDKDMWIVRSRGRNTYSN